MNFTILIPARLASTRLPNKPLADIAGLPMVVRVARRVTPAGAPGSQQRIVVATDSQSIVDACNTHGVESVLTRTDHASGSDRLAEACALLGLPDDHVVVNVQGDEPLIDPRLVQAVAQLLDERPDAQMSTAAHPIHALDEYANPNVVKVVTDARGNALYFSRAPLPWSRDKGVDQAWWLDPQRAHAVVPLRHIGIYGYRASFLRGFPLLARSPLEDIEALEQLRVMWHGHRIAVHTTLDDPGPGVDTAQDLERVRRMLGH